MPEISATPDIPDSQVTSYGSNTSGVKVATPDIILFNEETLPADLIAGLIFEGIGSQEIITISRNDIINGQDVSYNLIGNLKTIGRQYNTKNIFSLPETIDKYMANFSIRFDTHVPEEGTGPNGERVYVEAVGNPTVDRGDLVIDVVNMETNERVDVEVLRRGAPLSDTIYTEES